MRSRQRVFTYITQERELLVFDHVDFPDAGTQVPGGTIEDGEDPQAAAIREAREETGLEDLSVQTLLARETLDMTPYGKPERVDCWFFHLHCGQATKSRWQHAETDPSDGSTAPILFDLYWIPLGKPITLIGFHGKHLPKLQGSLGK